MGSWTITRWELKNTIQSRKFILIFFFQLAVLLMMVLFFNGFMSNIESQQGVGLTPSLNGFASLDVGDSQGIFKNNLNPQILDIGPASNSSLQLISQGKLTGLLLVTKNVSLTNNSISPLESEIFIDYSDPKRSVVRDEVQLAGNKTSAIISQELINSVSPNSSSQPPAGPQVQQQSTGESLPLQLITKIMTAVLLFLPLFLFGNLVVDSIVGEKERKTGEILIAMPISRAYIILGKSMAVVLTMAVQVALWMILMILAGFKLGNPLLVYLIVVITAVPIVGLTSIIAAYAKNYKEAGIGITFAYIAIIGFLIVPALAYVAQQGKSVSLSTMTLIIKIFSGSPMGWGDIVIPLVFILIISAISYWAAIWLFRRDDIVFGPRPGLFKLLMDFIGFSKIIKRVRGV
ncbi:MAG: ABC transporter permease [Methanobacteriales archaeon HGW-Methanobacteriales-1]|nr:MAG: ABC transporter permease [Methanobacteriales archaeon HGW-Methanobacteriales-1]